MNAEQFIIQVRIYGDKNEGNYPSYKTQIEHEIRIGTTSPIKLSEAVAGMVQGAVDVIVAELIKRAEEANKEPEEVTE